MKGLLVKDFRLLARQKNFFAIVVVISALFLLVGQDVMFIIGYATLVCTFFSISSIHYDEFNNGNTFLFTMPFTRKDYVLEKYIFGALLGGCGWAGTTVAGAIVTMIREPQTQMLEWFTGATACLAVLLILLAVVLPIEFKFGAEKGRIAAIGIFFVIFFIVTKVGKMANESGVDTERLVATIDHMSAPVLVGISIAVLVVIVRISIGISNKIMERKQF